jgi:hypothetical protein
MSVNASTKLLNFMLKTLKANFHFGLSLLNAIVVIAQSKMLQRTQMHRLINLAATFD